jgi:hypothetical protein
MKILRFQRVVMAVPADGFKNQSEHIYDNRYNITFSKNQKKCASGIQFSSGLPKKSDLLMRKICLRVTNNQVVMISSQQVSNGDVR